MNITAVIVLVAGIVLLLVASVRRHRRKERARADGLKRVASRLRFDFAEDENEDLRTRLKHFRLFSQGGGRKVGNVIRARISDLDVVLFDYRYTINAGQSSQTFRQTVALFEAPTTTFPAFALRPEHLFHKLGQVFGYRDIDFDAHPEFSKRYLLRGTDENRIRRLFSSDVLRHLERLQGISVEAAGEQLIYYRSGKRVPPDDIPAFLEEAAGVYGRLNA